MDIETLGKVSEVWKYVCFIAEEAPKKLYIFFSQLKLIT